MIVVLFQKGYFESRQGLIYGPFTPVYGIGGIAYYITFKLIKTRNKGKVFFVSMILGGLTEYIASYVQEKAFGTISWDYSYLLFNLMVGQVYYIVLIGELQGYYIFCI